MTGGYISSGIEYAPSTSLNYRYLLTYAVEHSTAECVSIIVKEFNYNPSEIREVINKALRYEEEETNQVIICLLKHLIERGCIIYLSNPEVSLRFFGCLEQIFLKFILKSRIELLKFFLNEIETLFLNSFFYTNLKSSKDWIRVTEEDAYFWLTIFFFL